MRTGQDVGYSSGKQDGYDLGKEEGYNTGYTSGKADGYDEGVQAGLGHGYTLRDPTYTRGGCLYHRKIKRTRMNILKITMVFMYAVTFPGTFVIMLRKKAYAVLMLNSAIQIWRACHSSL